MGVGKDLFEVSGRFLCSLIPCSSISLTPLHISRLHPVYTHSSRSSLAKRTEAVLSPKLRAPSLFYPSRASDEEIPGRSLLALIPLSRQGSNSTLLSCSFTVADRLSKPHSLCVIHTAVLHWVHSKGLEHEGCRAAGATGWDSAEDRDLVARLIGEDAEDKHLHELCWVYYTPVGE